jgi:hypothetical protein
MKTLTRGWWPGIDSDIQVLVENCAPCNANKNSPPKEKQHFWKPSKGPMHRVHADFAGPFLGQCVFVLVNAYSKWFEVYSLKNITTETANAKKFLRRKCLLQTTIELLRRRNLQDF